MAVVLEVAISETEAKLHRDMGSWFDVAQRNARMAIVVVKANRTRPTITMDKWDWNTTNVSSSPTRALHHHQQRAAEFGSAAHRVTGTRAHGPLSPRGGRGGHRDRDGARHGAVPLPLVGIYPKLARMLAMPIPRHPLLNVGEAAGNAGPRAPPNGAARGERGPGPRVVEEEEAID
ncbi:hypothetical protein N7449_009944 [Penicillium cf. viridicatum]|uniref:Uncharacterized protein n=1 Tax=Penicillium cf. viridicatum TaxID=2972119 RepID=A0A9W9IY74_9EURO|nr:hypothetical protein N7449_009944 [Penicillium cf. viridicatum]